jgi:RND family efflux transporter MFP subunit
VVTKRYADTGALIQAGTASDTQSMPVVHLAEWSRLRLVVPVPDSAVPELHLGNSVSVRVSALNRDFEGHVARFADSLNDETRTMHTEIDVENSDGTLKDGMYAEAKIVLSQQNDALTVPIQAVERNSSGASVLVVNAQGLVEDRPVKLGTESSNRLEVLHGLAENERVIIGNHAEFRAGEKVKPKVVDENVLAEGAV